MFTGALVLNIFGACWCICGLLSLGAPLWLLPLPLLVAAGLIETARRAIRHVPPRTPEDEKRIGRLIGLWSGLEGVAIFVAIPALQVMHAEVDIGSAMALIVGLHFFPLARGMPLPLYYASGTALVVIALVSFYQPASYRFAAACFPSGVILWATSAILSARALARREVLL
jgi:hypothetical protein